MKVAQHIFKTFLFLLCLLFFKTGFAQNVGISSNSSFTPDASAALDVNYTSKGLLIPRVALTATNAAGPITSPATSLMVYNTATAGTAPNNVIPGYYYWNGAAWIMLSTSTQTGANWSLTGNTGITPSTNFLGTTDLNSVRFKTNKVSRLLVDSLGNVAVGNAPIFSSTAREKFLVDAGSVNYPTPAGAFNVISGKGYLDGYLQLNIQNTSPTANASSDIVASNDAATETTNYVDMGINSSANTTTGILGGANLAYLLATGNDFAIGNGALSKNLLFFTSGTTSPATNTERMRIDPSGNVGINNVTPTEKLDVTGNLRFSGALMPNNTAGTAGYFLMTNGSGVSPTWFNANNLITTQAWGLTGNTGTTAGTNFIGTTDLKDFIVKTNNAERLRVSSTGDVAIGGTAFNATNPEQLLVDAGSTSTTPTTSFNVISGKGYIDKYLQLNIQNLAATASASSDIVASNDAATESINYVDLGINSSGNTSTGILGGANTAYLLATGSDFAIGNGTPNKNLIFYTGGTTAATPANLERLRIDPSGNVGIGTTSPATKLHVFGANPLTLSGVATGTSTSADSLLTITSGLVRKLPISTFASSANAWSTLGNAGTTAGTNFIGTTDAVDFVLKANNVERLRIVNGSSSVTGTTGDITVGDANSGTLRSTKEMVMRQDGDTFGPSTLRLRNRSGQNGAIFETTGGTANLVDFIFNTGPVATPISSNIRFETRSSNMKVTGNTTEWQLGQPDAVNGGPTLVIGAYGTGSSSAFLTGKVGIGTNTPLSTLDVSGSVGAAITVITTTNTITLDATYYTVILTAAASITLPAAGSTNARRIYVIVNETGTARAISNYISFAAAGTTTIAANSSITIQSNGTNWYRIQ